MPMHILPQGDINLLADTETQTQTLRPESPSLTYRIDFDRRRVAGYLNEQAAMEQAIFLALQTWLHAHDIYDDQYGFQARGLIGHKPAYVYSELRRRIKEALLVDGRIYDVYDFAFQRGEAADALTTAFKVKTRFGVFDTAIPIYLTE